MDTHATASGDGNTRHPEHCAAIVHPQRSLPMTFWQSICNWFDSTHSTSDPIGTTTDDHFTHINPATGLPMAGDGFGGVDVGGSPFGTDIHHDTFTHNSFCIDPFSDH
jgi:hypothetical protein